jgi:hypothetical protein
MGLPEPITMVTILISFFLGATIGIIKITTGDSKVKALFDAAGFIALVLFLGTTMPESVWGAPINEVTQNLSDYIISAVWAIAVYAITDASSGLAYSLITGSR